MLASSLANATAHDYPSDRFRALGEPCRVRKIVVKVRA